MRCPPNPNRKSRAAVPGVFLSLVVLMAWPAVAAPGPTVVLDPGHGGTNQGAYGPRIRAFEKVLTLEISHRVARLVRQWVPGVRVVLTRERDRFTTALKSAGSGPSFS